MPEHLDDNGFVVLDAPTPHLTAAAVVDCGLCDDDGYRGALVCDHVDHTPAARRGMAKVRQILTQGPRRGTDTADTPEIAQRGAESQQSASGAEV